MQPPNLADTPENLTPSDILLINGQKGHMCPQQVCSALRTLKSKVTEPRSLIELPGQFKRMYFISHDNVSANNFLMDI